MRIKNPSKFYYGIAILSFIISGYFSVLLFQSSATTLTEAIPMIAIAIILELAKFSLLRELSNSNHAAWLKVSFFSLWVIITLSSIVASAGYVINQTNKATNESIKMSDSYKIKMASRDNQNDLYGTKKQELNNLYTAKENALKDLQTQREALPKNYISKKVEMGVRMNEVEQDYNNRISKISSELSTISNSLAQEVDLSSTQVNSTNGYTAIFQLSADIYNKNATEKVTASGLELWFFLALGVVLELVANVFAYLSMVTGKIKSPIPQPENKMPIPELEKMSKNSSPQKLKVAHAGNVVSIASKGKQDYKQAKNEQDLSNKDIKMYLDIMYSNTKNDNESIGYKNIASKISEKYKMEFKPTKAYKIKNHLEKLGVISVDGATTKIICEQGKALLAVKKGA